MALYDLVSLKKALREIDISIAVNALTELQEQIHNIKNKASNISDQRHVRINTFADQYQTLIDQVHNSVQDRSILINEVDQEITQLAHQLFSNSYELEERTGGFDHVRNFRKIQLREDVEQAVKQRILLHTNWRYPALEIGCRDGEWTQFLVAADPLYIMDQWSEFLDSTNSRFPDAYKNRLRKYPLKNYDLSALPKNQFAFVFSWGHFNYVSLDSITQVLKQLRDILRPGGVFLFSYNDGDSPAGAGMAESFAQTYMPKSLLIPICESLGYEIAGEFDYAPNISWLEIKKPGTLHTIKAHQAMGKILPRKE